jgi:hypothetical protein
VSPNRRFKFQKRGQLFIRPHDEPLSIVAVRVSTKSQISHFGLG